MHFKQLDLQVFRATIHTKFDQLKQKKLHVGSPRETIKLLENSRQNEDAPPTSEALQSKSTQQENKQQTISSPFPLPLLYSLTIALTSLHITKHSNMIFTLSSSLV